jgi:hypothetical protein
VYNVCNETSVIVFSDSLCRFRSQIYVSFGIWFQVVNSTYALWTWHRNQDVYGENSVGDQIYIVRQPDKCLLQPTSASSLNWWFDLMIKLYLLRLNIYSDPWDSLFWECFPDSPAERCPSPMSSSRSSAHLAVTSAQLFWKLLVNMCVVLIYTVEATCIPSFLGLILQW